ncbi:DMT family transporter [Agromyces sp. NPDC049794]|uniref:DMT family transporter n=1 Tax=unclassified Agromyces TaxID=2639701 RepID=UPI0033D56EE8
MSRRGWLILLALGAIWGMPYLLIKIALVDFDPMLIAFGRTLTGALVLAPFALGRSPLRAVISRWPAVLAFTLVEISGPWLLLGHAETLVSSSTAALFIAVVPILTTAIAAGTQRDRITPVRALGLGVGFLGVAVLTGFDLAVTSPWALGALALTALGYAIGPMIMSRYLSGVPRITVVAASLLLAAAVYAPFVPGNLPVRFEVQSVVAMIVLGVICSALGFALFFDLVAEVGPARSTLITYLNPAVAILLGVAILGEPLSPGIALGMPMILAGSLLASRRPGPALDPPRPQVVTSVTGRETR